MPSILVELGFITNSNDESVIASKNGQKNLARGIFNGFKEYYETYGKPKKKSSVKAVPQETKNTKTTVKKEEPVFKIQILVSSNKLPSNDTRLKGVKADCYKENGMYKYTVGESNDYDEIVKIKKDISTKFAEAFIIAFVNDKKINTQEAIRIFKNKK